MANNMSVLVLYESMSLREITPTDLSLQEGFILQDEFVDMSNPDEGIFWDRAGVWASDLLPEKDTVSDEEDDEEDFRQVHERITVVPAKEMPYVLGLWVKGRLALIRDEAAKNECKLKNVLLKSFRLESDDDAEASFNDFIKAILKSSEEAPTHVEEVEEEDSEDEVEGFDVEL